MEKKIRAKYEIDRDAAVEFCNHADYCVGTGRMDLALQEEYLRQLELVQEHVGHYGYIEAHEPEYAFGDVFEECGVPFTPFHGGFGLVANGVIPKPTFWTFVFFKKLQGDCVHRSGEAGDPQGPAEFCLIRRTVDEQYGNPLKCWHDLGEPANPSISETEFLREAARPRVQTDGVTVSGGRVEIELTLAKNAVVEWELRRVVRQQDTGYDYERVTGERRDLP